MCRMMSRCPRTFSDLKFYGGEREPLTNENISSVRRRRTKVCDLSQLVPVNFFIRVIKNSSSTGISRVTRVD